MERWLRAVRCTVVPADAQPEFFIWISPEEEGEFPTGESDGQIRIDDRFGNQLTWSWWFASGRTALELLPDSDRSEAPIALVEEAKYFVELALKPGLDCAVFQQLLGNERNSFASMASVPRQPRMWLMQTRSSAGVIPLSVGSVTVLLEVRPAKLDYQADLRQMITDLAEQGVNFLLDPRSPTGLRLKMSGLDQDERSPYLLGVTMNALFNSPRFREALSLVRAWPYRELREEVGEAPTGAVQGLISSQLTEAFGSPSNLAQLPPSHPLYGRLRGQLPLQVRTSWLGDDLATPENRYLAFILDYLMNQMSDIVKTLADDGRVASSGPVIHLMENIRHLGGDLSAARSSEPFLGLDPLAEPPTHSTVLTGRPGYREVHATWVLWNSGIQLGHIDEDEWGIYGGSKLLWRLYQDWCLLAVHSALEVGPPGGAGGVIWKKNSSLWHLARSLDGKKHLSLVPGKSFRMGHWQDRCVGLYYGKEFPYKGSPEFPSSYSVKMTPDITVVLTRRGTKLRQMIHFDAKYGVAYASGEEEATVKDGIAKVKTSDIEKMHAYQDALRSPLGVRRPFTTEGTFVLYPGTKHLMRPWDRTETVLMSDVGGQWYSGVGALSMRPASDQDFADLRRLIWNWVAS